MNVLRLYEDNHLLVLSKPAGLLSQGDKSGDPHLVAWAEADLVKRHHKPGRAFVGLVHRLDRNTSGVMVLAKTSKAARRLSEALRRHDVRRIYLAIVRGHVHEDMHCVDELPRLGALGEGEKASAQSQRASLFLRPLARSGGDFPSSLVQVELETGRKHQIRRQLSLHGHPVLGDRRYGNEEKTWPLKSPMLHSWALGFEHPVKHEALAFFAPLPEAFQEMMAQLQLKLAPAVLSELPPMPTR